MSKTDLLCVDCVHRTDCYSLTDKATGCLDYYPDPPIPPAKRIIRGDFPLQSFAIGIALGLAVIGFLALL